MALLRPVGMVVVVALWNVPLAAGLWVGGRGFGRGLLVAGVLLAGWLLAAWFATPWRGRFFTPDAPARLSDEQVLWSAAGVVGLAALGYAVF